MRYFARPASLLLIVAFALPLAVQSFETDQYNLPTTPLADIGEEITEYLEQNLREAMDEVNGKIRVHQACLAVVKRGGDCRTPAEETKKLAELRSEDAVADALFDRVGDGSMLTTKFDHWFKDHKFRAQPSSYFTSFKQSIYVGLPTDYWTISPTVKMYGVEFGTDKLDHIFQQGHKYYRIEKEEAAITTIPGGSVKKAVKWGRTSENTYYGLFVSGVYSNADLAANLAGMHFYQGLTKDIKIGEKTRPAPIALKEGLWQINDPDLRANLIKPFISEHLNEALNPSVYAINLYSVVKAVVQHHSCDQWEKAYPNFTRASLKQKTADLELWYGEDYGNTQKDRMVRLSDTCF